jgi:HAD superfamily hydrolase (TIGR01490 family)
MHVENHRPDRTAMPPSVAADAAPGPRAAAFFDLDKTIIAKSSTLAFGRSFYQGGLINRRAVLKTAYAQFVYMIGGADHDQMERMRSYLSTLCAGWDVQQVREIVAETLHTLIDPLIYEEAVELIAQHQAAGREVIIVSTSGAEVVEPIGEILGVDLVIATRMVSEDGRYTGEIEFYAYGENKAEAIKDLAASHGYDLDACYGYSDSVTDLPMLETIGHPHAVNPDRGLRKEAAARGWPVLTFANPISLRSRVANFPMSNRKALAATALGAGAAAAGLVWYVARRRGGADPS